MLRSRESALCLLAAMIASTSYACIDDSYTGRLYGAALDADCVRPCDDTWIHSITECRDLPPPPERAKDITANGCRNYECAINSLRFLKCTPPAGGSGEVLCGWKKDNTQWNRWVVARSMPCTDNGKYTYTYPRCVGSPYATETTPCVTNQCNGDLVRDSAEEWGKAVCP